MLPPFYFLILFFFLFHHHHLSVKKYKIAQRFMFALHFSAFYSILLVLLLHAVCTVAHIRLHNITSSSSSKNNIQRLQQCTTYTRLVFFFFLTLDALVFFLCVHFFIVNCKVTVKRYVQLQNKNFLLKMKKKKFCLKLHKRFPFFVLWLFVQARNMSFFVDKGW